jgi:hypothetical protein
VIEPYALDQPRLVTGQDCRSADLLAEGFALPAAKKDAIASTPTQGPLMTEVSSTGFGAKAAANSFVPFL